MKTRLKFTLPGMLCFWLLACPIFRNMQAQIISDEHPQLQVGDGISFSKDSVFLVNLRFRMQNRLGFYTNSGSDLGISSVEARVRRLRLRFEGYMISPKLAYYIQLSFSQSDMNLSNGSLPFPIRDAMVYYFARPNLYFGFGQSKLPGNRQRVNSSGNLQMPDRSVANNYLTLDRDFGLFAYWDIPIGQQHLAFKAALSSGDGRGGITFDNGMAYTFRMEYLPFGKFTDEGDYFEGDLIKEPKPKLSIGLVGHYNQKARYAGGTHGLRLDAPADLYSAIADLCFKYRGFAFNAEWLYRNAPRTPGASEIVTPHTGFGIMATASRILGKKSELAARYSFYQPNEKADIFYSPITESGIGYTYYIHAHRIKTQGYLGYRVSNNNWDLDRIQNGWTLMFQVEFGI